MQDPDDTIHEMQEEINEHEQRQIQLQAEIDRLTAQNLQLRLIADRAASILMASNQFDHTHLDDHCGPVAATYLESVGYEDSADEYHDTTEMIVRTVVEPLLEIIQQSPAETNLLELAMAEQNRKKLVDEEIQQLFAFVNLPNVRKQESFAALKDQASIARHALHFARQAGVVTPKEKLFDMFSPCVMLARSLKK